MVPVQKASRILEDIFLRFVIEYWQGRAIWFEACLPTSLVWKTEHHLTRVGRAHTQKLKKQIFKKNQKKKNRKETKREKHPCQPLLILTDCISRALLRTFGDLLWPITGSPFCRDKEYSSRIYSIQLEFDFDIWKFYWRFYNHIFHLVTLILLYKFTFS